MANASVSQMTETIQEYLNETSYNYAIMLTGDWGSGVYFFISKQNNSALFCFPSGFKRSMECTCRDERWGKWIIQDCKI